MTVAKHNDGEREDASTRRPTLDEAIEMVRKLEEHIDYCGWGDSWERECAAPLRAELAEFNRRLE